MVYTKLKLPIIIEYLLVSIIINAQNKYLNELYVHFFFY